PEMDPVQSRNLVRLFVTDIDGCLSEPYQPFRLDRLSELASMVAGVGLEDQPPGPPALSICSGRAYPYVEAMTQLLGLRHAVVFEAGGGLFDPVKARWYWNPAFTGELAREIDEVQSWLVSEIMPGTQMGVDHSKKTQASLAGPIVEEVRAAVPRVEEFVDRNLPHLLVAHTDISIDVVPRTLNKASGMRWLADTLGVSLHEMAFIGDTNGDIPALELVGHSFAPSNATEAVRNTANITTSGAVIDGVIEAYGWCSRQNREIATNEE
ncbi:MAG: HAD family hydrolase, partial [Rhodothermales bacterium]|nr:HAD family hydrolase [Rhodothermales bacterium]